MTRRTRNLLAVVPDKRTAAVCADLLSHALDSAPVAELVIRDLVPEDFTENERPIFEALKGTLPLGNGVDIARIAECTSWTLLSAFQARERHITIDGVYGALREIRRAKTEGEIQQLIRSGEYGVAAAMLSRIGNVDEDGAGAPGRVTGAMIETFLAQSGENQKRGYLGPTTGLRALDKLTLGMAPGSVWGVGGATSSGKSTFLAQIIVEAVLQGAVAAIFSLEMPVPWVIARLLGAYLRKNPTRIFMGDVNARALPRQQTAHLTQ
jgi:hypothetical protein